MGAAEDLAVDREKGVVFAKAVGRLLLARHGPFLGARRRQDVVNRSGRLNGPGVGAILEPVGACLCSCTWKCRGTVDPCLRRVLAPQAGAMCGS